MRDRPRKPVDAGPFLFIRLPMIPRRTGLEHEIFVVEPGGEPSQRAEELVHGCQRRAAGAGLAPENFTVEWVKNIIELNSPIAGSADELSDVYWRMLGVARSAARELGVRLYPYAVYPIHLIPVIRDEMKFHVQVRTIGHERFANAGRCAGVHLHLEAPAGTVDASMGVGFASTAEARRELINVYNLATALDPVMIALSRSCPFYEGKSTGLAHHTARYRGSAEYGWDGVYLHHPAVGGLRPYAESAEHLVQMQFERYHSWLNALDAAEVDRKLFHDAGGDLLSSSWNPVRLNRHGTVELRNIDSNLPHIVLGVARMVLELHRRVVDEHLEVTPTAAATTMTVTGNQLRVPDFEYLRHHLLFGAVSEGLADQPVSDYVASVLEVARTPVEAGGLGAWIHSLADFQTTEAKLLERYFPEGETLSRETGLQLVREACDEFEFCIERGEITGELSA